MREWSLSPHLLLTLNVHGINTHTHTRMSAHILTAAQLSGWEEPFPPDERQSRGQRGRDREAGLWSSRKRGNLTGPQQSSHNLHRLRRSFLSIKKTFFLQCGPTPGEKLEAGRTEQHAGPGRQGSEEGDGDRVSSAVQKSGRDRGRAGGGVTGGSGESGP